MPGWKVSYTTGNLCFHIFKKHAFSWGGRVSQITFAHLKQVTYFSEMYHLQLPLIRKENLVKQSDKHRELNDWMPHAGIYGLSLHSFTLLNLLGLPVEIPENLIISMRCLFWVTACCMPTWDFCCCVFLLITPVFQCFTVSKCASLILGVDKLPSVYTPKNCIIVF